MLSRRELISAGVAGSMMSPGATAAASPALEQSADREGQREIANQIRSLDRTLDNALLSNSLSHGHVAKIRADMEQFLRASGRFPDFFDIGIGVFYDVYDWHVRNRQPIVITRVENRYAIQFMFTVLILRTEQDRQYIGVPYDKG